MLKLLNRKESCRLESPCVLIISWNEDDPVWSRSPLFLTLLKLHFCQCVLVTSWSTMQSTSVLCLAETLRWEKSWCFSSFHLHPPKKQLERINISSLKSSRKSKWETLTPAMFIWRESERERANSAESFWKVETASIHIRGRYLLGLGKAEGWIWPFTPEKSNPQ